MEKRDSVSVYFDEKENRLHFHASGNLGYQDYIGSIKIEGENIKISVNPTNNLDPKYQRLYEVSEFPHDDGGHDPTYG
jgi:hypothetical protein